jgi:long-chain acyl-CoA synthetase
MARDTLLADFLARADAQGDRIALEELVAGGAAHDRALTWREWERASRATAAALVRGGLRPGDRVGILAGNRNLWPVADVGVLLAGGVSVGLYPTSAPEQLAQLLADCGAVAVVVDTAEQLAKVRAIASRLPRLAWIVTASGVPADMPATDGGPRIEAWDHWLAGGEAALRDRAEVGAEVRRRTAAATPDTVAILVYTSGSTGEPKGARLTHRCLRASAVSVRDTLGFAEADTMLSFLPYSHAGERVFGLCTRLLCGMRAAHVEDLRRLWEAARAFEPTVFGAMPRFYEKIHEALVGCEATLDDAARAAWREGLRLGAERAALRRRGTPVPPVLEEAWRAAAAGPRQAIADLLGTRVRLATSGGAMLPVAVADYLDAAGLTVLGAYGQTEHLCIAFHRPGRYDVETVGPPMPGTEVRLADDGELLVRRGALTFDGYHDRPDETRAAFTADGAWLLTGDLAELTADGRLRITGRKKELIALSNGKKVAPLPIEAALTDDAWIAHALVHGEGERFLTALLVPNRPVVEAWLRERGVTLPWEQALAHPEVTARLQAAVDRANAPRSRPEQVRRWVALEHELTVERDELTPTLKLRRPIVAQRYAARLAPLYAEGTA